MPVSVFGAIREFEICVVADTTPVLLSRYTISRLGLSIDFSKNTISSPLLGICNETVAEVGGHLVIDLLADDLVQSCQGYKESGCDLSGIRETSLSEHNPQSSMHSTYNNHAHTHATSEVSRPKHSTKKTEDQWMRVGMYVFRIHVRPRLTLFTPELL